MVYSKPLRHILLCSRLAKTQSYAATHFISEGEQHFYLLC